MTHVKVTINDVVEFDGGVDEWIAKPPDRFRDAIKADASPKPWMKAVMIALADAVLLRQSMTIDVDTSPPQFSGWTMKVRY